MYFTNQDIYLGEWKSEIIEGIGIYFFRDGEVYKGSFKDGNKNGYGSYYYHNGNIYEGDWNEGVKHGRGKIYNPETNYEFSGEFKFNCKTGKGFEKSSEGIFQGYYKNGKKHGEGQFQFSDGTVFIGQYQEDDCTGYGAIKYANGDIYEGEFKNGLKHGQGLFKKNPNYDPRFSQPQNSHEKPSYYREIYCVEYKGSWYMDFQHGKGECRYSNGDIYTGELAESRKHGYGEYVSANGQVFFKGYWQHDFKVSGTHQTQDYIYIGSFINNLREGQGKIRYTQIGEEYEGSWKNDQKNGKGIYKYTDGKYFEGEWIDDQIWGSGILKGPGMEDLKGSFHGNKFHPESKSFFDIFTCN